MPKLEEISTLPVYAIELLKAAGCHLSEELRDAETDKLVGELVRVNKELSILPESPTRESLEQWRELALLGGGTPKQDKLDAAAVKGNKEAKNMSEGKAQGSPEDKEDSKSKADEAKGTDSNLINLEQNSGILEMLAVSPRAEPLDAESMHDRKLSFADMPDGLLLSRCEGKIKINIMTTLGRADAHIRQNEVRRLGLKASRIRNFEDLESGDHHVKPLERGDVKDENALSEGLNKGVKHGSRRFIKGVVNPNPVRMYLGALSSILFVITLAANVVGIVSIYLFRTYISDELIIGSMIGLIATLFVAVLCYLYLASKARCRVCGQLPLMPKKCAKHRKAHHIPGIGYILPTALQMIFYKWFYCTYCGTAIRLKK